MSTETLDLPTIDPSALAQPSGLPAVSIAPAAPDLTKIDLTDVALAMYGPWRKTLAETKTKLSTLVLDLSTPTKIKEARTLRARLIGEPLAAARKVSQGIKSKMAATSKAVGAELETMEAGYTEADKLILPKIEAAEEAAKREREEKQRIERERIEKHQTNIARIRAYAEKAELPDMTAERIAAGMAQLEAIPVPTKEAWEEFAVPAADAICWTLDRMRITHARVLRAEQAEAEAAELRAKLAATTTTQPAPGGEQVDGCRAPESHSDGCSGPVTQDHTSLPVSPSTEYPKDGAQQVLKAEPATADATDRAPTSASPCVGTMGAGQAADAAPAGGTINAATIERGAIALDAGSAAVIAPVYVAPDDGGVHRFAPGPITMIEPATEAGRMIVSAKSAADFVPTSSTDPRDELLREALALTKYAAAPFAGKFPTHPKTTPEWWAGLREQIEALQPKLIEHLEGLN